MHQSTLVLLSLAVPTTHAWLRHQALPPRTRHTRPRLPPRRGRVASIEGERISASSDPSRPIWLYDAPHAVKADEWDLVVDARSPSEFEEDRVPGSVNLPVLDDAERAEVGTLYASSPFDARVRGASLVAARLAGILGDDRVARLPKESRILVYCWRGGDRSGSLTHSLSRVGWHVAQLEGGYKAYRARVREALYGGSAPALLRRCVAVGGATGSAKGKVLDALEALGAQVVDLEGLARHRGSILGALPGAEQPTQKGFESALYDAIRGFDGDKPVFVELESPKVGRLDVPRPIFKRLASAPVVEVVLPMNERVKWIRSGYAHFEDGGAGTEKLRRLLEFCAPTAGKKAVARWNDFVDAGDWDGFVEAMLEDHYDPGYDRACARDRSSADASSREPWVVELPTTADGDVDRAARAIVDEVARWWD